MSEEQKSNLITLQYDDRNTPTKFTSLTVQPSLSKSISTCSGKSPTTKRGQTKVTYQQIKSYIIEDPKNRQIFDISKMQSYLRTLPYFEKICSKLDSTRQASVLEKFCKKMRYQQVQKGQFLFKPNEKSEYFYILLEGKVSILIPKRDDRIEIEKQSITNKLTKNLSTQITQFYEGIPCQALKLFAQKNSIKNSDKNRMSVTSLLDEGNLPYTGSQNTSPQENNNNNNNNNQNTQIQVISPFRQNNNNTIPSQFKLKHCAEQPNIIQNNSRSSLLQVPKSSSKRESMKSFTNLDQNCQIVPKAIKQQFTKEQQAVLEEQNRQLNIAVEGESDQYGQQYEELFDTFVFKYTFGKSLNSGEAIGGVDIINNKSRREAALCIQNSEFAYITKSEFIDILKEIEESKFNKKLNRLIQSLDPEIPHLRRLMGRLVSFLKTQTYKRGQVIYRQNDEIDGCYLITQGEVQIVQELLMNPPESHLEKYAFKQIQPNKQMHTLAYVSVGQYIGEEEMILQQEVRHSSAICNSYECKLYFIEQSHFLKLISDQLDIRLAFEKAIKQRTQFNDTKFNQLQKIIQSNYNDKFISKDNHNSVAHLQKYRDDQNQFRDCFQKILYLERESERKKEIPKSQERIGGVSMNKLDSKGQNNQQKRQIKLNNKKIKSKSQHNLKDGNNTIPFNVCLKLKENQNNSVEALTDHYIKQQNKQKQINEKSQKLKRSVSFNPEAENIQEKNEEVDKQENDNNNNNIINNNPNNQKRQLDMLDYLLKGNKHASCQVINYLKKYQKKESIKEKMSKTNGLTFFQGIEKRINDVLILKQNQEDSNQIFQTNNLDFNKTKNIHVNPSQDTNNLKNQQNLKSNSEQNSSNIQQSQLQQQQQFCGPVSRPYTPDLDFWKKSSIKQQNLSNQENQSFSKTSNKFCNILNNLSYNRNHELHLVKSHKCFSTSQSALSQIIKKKNQIISAEDIYKQSYQKDMKQISNIELNGQKLMNKTDQNISIVIHEKPSIPFNSPPPQPIQQINQNTSTNQIDSIQSYHINSIFRPKQRPLSSVSIRSSRLKQSRTNSTDKDITRNNTAIFNGSNFNLSRHDLSFETKISNHKSTRLIIVNHMGQPKKYIY